MATESLIVELDAKTSKLDSKLTSSTSKINKLDGDVKKVDVSLAKMARVAVAGATAVAGAMTVLITTTAQFAKELEVAARRAGTTVEEMQSLAFATNTVGISLEKLGDISKDTNEKIGEFSSTGGGGFVDFIDVMKLSREEANKLASEFQSLSGPEVLQRMVNMMEEAGVSSNQMSFALEGVASDATDLIPLLQENGKELGRLRDEFDALGKTLTQEDIDKIKEVSEEFSKLGQEFSAGGRQLIADYSSELIAAIDLIRTLAITTSDAFNVISTGWGNLIELAQAGLTDLVNGTDTFAATLEERTKLTTEALDKLLGHQQKSLEVFVTKGDLQLKGSVERDKLSYKQKLDIFSKYTKAASIINSAFLEDNKAIQAGIIVADTATGIMRAFATSSNIYEAYANAAVVAATGVAQLANLQSASKGGGSISSGESPSGQSTSQPQGQDVDETSTLDISEQGDFGTQEIRLIITDDSGNQFLDGIANGLEERTRQGR